MKLFTCLAILALTTQSASANRATDLVDEAFSTLTAGKIEEWKALFSEDFKIRVNLGEIDFSFTKKLVSISAGDYLKAFQKLTIFKMDYTVYADPSDDLKGAYDGDFYLKDESGQRYNVKFICKYALDEAGKIILADHQAYLVQKIDAKAAVERLVTAWTTGNADGVIAEYDENVVVKTDFGKGAGATSIPGTYVGHAGLFDMMKNQGDVIDFEATKKGDGSYALNTQFLETKDDGKTAFVKFDIPAVYKNGAEYIQHYDAQFKVTDFGKIVDYQFYETYVTKFEKASGKEEL